VRNRPALRTLIPFVLGIVAAYAFDFPIVIMLMILATTTLVLVVVPSRLKTFKFFDILIITGLFMAGALRLELAKDNLSQFDISVFNDVSEPIAIEGLVVRAPESRSDKIILTVAVDSVYWREFPVSLLPPLTMEYSNIGDTLKTISLKKALPATGKVLITLREIHNHFNYGDRLFIRGQLEQPRGQRNPGEFDYRKYLAANGIRACMNVRHDRYIQVLSKGNGSWLLGKVVYPLRSYIISCIDQNISGQEGALLKGLLVGERGDIDHDLQTAFAKVGVIHVLAVSGLHVGFVVLAVMVLLRMFRVPRKWRVVMTIALLVLHLFDESARAGNSSFDHGGCAGIGQCVGAKNRCV